MPSSESCSLYVRDLFMSQMPRQTNRAAGNLPRLFCAKPKDGRLPNLNHVGFSMPEADAAVPQRAPVVP